MMGLYDMYAWAGNQQALEILVKWSRWFSHGPPNLPRRFDDILDVETGGMLEALADLYGVTGEKEHYELIKRYDRRQLFHPLIAGKDVLTNMHANTTIPEIHGAARAWEVTGEIAGGALSRHIGVLQLLIGVATAPAVRPMENSGPLRNSFLCDWE